MDTFSLALHGSTNFSPLTSNDNPGESSYHSLIPSPSDFSIGTWPLQNSDSHLLFSNFLTETLKIPKKEPPSLFNPDDSKLATDIFTRSLPGLQPLEPETGFESLITNLGSNQRRMELVEDLEPMKKRARQQRISDKYRSLQKLMPTERRMDTATMLGEAYKYIKFLENQVKVLKMMPAESRFNSESGALGSVFGEMGILSRQQLLQVVLSTPEAQTRLYSQGCCLYSTEQLVALKNFAERTAALRQLMFHSTFNT